MLPRTKSPLLTAACLVLSLGVACSDDLGGPTTQEFGTISGFVIADLKGTLTGVSGVTVRLSQSPLSGLRQATTGVDGEFTFTNVETGRWYLLYELPMGFVVAHGPTPSTVTVTANHKTVVPTLTVNDHRGTNVPPDSAAPASPVGTISGYILDDAGGALVGVSVRLDRYGFERRTTTGDDGGFTFTDVVIGVWALMYEVPAGFVLAQGLNHRAVLVIANQEIVVPPFRLNDHPVRIVKFNDLQIGKPGEKLSYWVRAFGTIGNALGAVPIQWAVTSGGGFVEAVQDVSAFRGIVHVLGPSLGPQTVTARAPTITSPYTPTVTFWTMVVSEIVEVLGCTGTHDYCRGVEATAFSPSTVQIAPGQTVGWRWNTEFIHNIIFEDVPTEPVSSWAQDDGTHLRAFDQATTVRYRCTFHSTSFTEGMVGTVVVK